MSIYNQHFICHPWELTVAEQWYLQLKYDEAILESPADRELNRALRHIEGKLPASESKPRKKPVVLKGFDQIPKFLQIRHAA